MLKIYKMIAENYLIRQALEIIRGYAFLEPLHHYLKQVFRANKKMGARDRRNMRDLVYAYFRVGHSCNSLTENERLHIGFFLVHRNVDGLSERLFLAHDKLKIENITAGIAEKIAIVKSAYPSFNDHLLFPFKEYTSSALDFDAFNLSMLTQPDVWLRVLPSRMQEVIAELQSLDINYSTNEKCELALSVDQGLKVKETNSYKNGWIEIQDLSSQLTGNYFNPKPNEQWYDCCAASGGKSLLLLSKEPNVKLIVSDTRVKILDNLKERFERAGVKHFEYFVADLLVGTPSQIQHELLDGIIVDAPCSGSGTWGRNPEQIESFKIDQINHYSNLQQTILKNVWPLLKPGGKLIYITCSVFKQENEGAIEFINQLPNSTIENFELIQGVNDKADTMFVGKVLKGK